MELPASGRISSTQGMPAKLTRIEIGFMQVSDLIEYKNIP
jgi:hypothetical protein